MNISVPESGLRATRRAALSFAKLARLFVVGWTLSLQADDAVEMARFLPFIETHCADCHDDLTREAGLDLLSLEFNPDDESNFSIWVQAHDRIRAGEMPPKKRARLGDEERGQFLDDLGASLKAAEEARIAKSGRAMKRRLNRYEYENTLRDLLDVPWVQIRDQLPEDGEKYRYNKVGEALDVSHVQLARYMSVADHAIRQAMSARLERPETTTNRYYARDEFSLTGSFRPRENSTLPDRHSFPVLDSRAQPDVRAGRSPLTSPETREREAVGKVSSIFSDAGGYQWSRFQAPVAGRYRLRFKGYTIWVSGGGISRWFFEGFGDEKAPLYYLPLWHRPNVDEVWPGRRHEPVGVYASSSGNNRPIGAFDFDPEPTEREIEVLLAPGERIRTDGMRLFRTRVNGSDEQYVNPLAQPDGMPGYAVQWMEVEGPLDTDSPGLGYQRMFGDLPMERVEDDQPGIALQLVAPQSTSGGPPGFGRRFGSAMIEERVEIRSDAPAEDAVRLLTSFMGRAYRRPVEDEEIQLFFELFKDQFAQGVGFAQSMVSAYTGVLASPGFLFVDEEPGRLDDHAVASRLSYFLWNSEPDDTLRSLAAAGELLRPETLRAQTERLLNHPKSRRFVEAFTDYWLDMRKLDDTSPSTTLYNDYELDDPLKEAALEETRLFIQELLRADLPARNIVDSDFTFLNERLADHYGIPGVRGAQLRRVTLPDDSVRGGLMTQASVLKVTANGTTTSPVMRGRWITERILGIETPPPPPATPAVEPDIRGAVTIRQQLEKHRADPICASCHSKMDPPGFALESFDVMGGGRARYRAAKEGVEPTPGVGLDGQKFTFHDALPVDCAGELPDGRVFADIRELKGFLLEDPESIARNVVKQLAVYATGAPVRFSDREEIEDILRRARSSEYGFRQLTQELVLSALFLEK